MANNIQTTEPFSDDQLGRKVIAEHFKNILLNTNLNVFSLVAPWGCGKTYFIQNLIRTMEEDSINILYNAWESDFYDSPLIPLLSELFVKLETLENKDKLKKDINWSKKFAKKVCKSTTVQAGINVKWFNCGLNFDPDKKMLDSDYIELKSEIQEFKCKLKNIQETLNKKIIIFIDELDRCNPMYTIKTLEVIKHFFGIANIVFVLVVDKSQIENSVRTIFGVNQGTENGYLRKFIDVEFELPEPNQSDFINYHLDKIWDKINIFIEDNRYYNYYLQRRVDGFGYEREMATTKEKIFLADLIRKTVKLLNFSLRDIEKYFMRFSLILAELAQEDILFIEPCIVLNALAMSGNDNFDDYIKSKIGSNNNLNSINNILPLWKGLFYKSYGDEIRNWRGGTIEADTIKSNVEHINKLLVSRPQNSIEMQEKYLQDYALKIKFINNFNTLN